ncbi:MAG TPA: NADH-quinone oxidoreductase subunit NuoE [Micromonosporaceae bacterium]|nr:NADH-quinone oxidoreductase subunit NuoE [Micromonosporaceae bacterium]
MPLPETPSAPAQPAPAAPAQAPSGQAAPTQAPSTQSPFPEATRERARQLMARYPVGRERSALLPLLHLVQAEEGYVSPAGIAFCAGQLGLTRAQVAAVATFYTMYKRRPAGDWLVSVCTNTMCDVLGGQRVFDALAGHLGVGHDETTADGTVTLEHAECLAACDYGPVLTVNYEFFDNMEPERAVALVEQLRAGGRPAPSRGARLCTLREMSLQLAGFADEREGAVADGPAGPATLRGNRLAEEHGVSVAGFDPRTPIGRPNGDQPGGGRPASDKAPDKGGKAPDKSEKAPGEGEKAPLTAVPVANQPASDGKPAGDAPLPQEGQLKEVKS